MDTTPTVTDPVTGDDRWSGRRRFARVGRVLPVAFLQIVGTLLASRFATVAGATGTVGGPPWARHTFGSGVDPVQLGPLAISLLVAGVVVLPWRWRWPRSVLLVTLATTIGYALVVSPRGPFVAALTMALANAWLRGHRRTVVVAAAVALVVLPTADLVLGRSSVLDLSAVVLCVAWLVVTVAVSELVRVRVERGAERRRQRVEAERQRAADERVRIARELHDSVAHSMSLINLQAGVALHLGDDLPEQTRDALTNIRDSSRDALVELRTILGVLRSVDSTAVDGGPERNPVPGLERLPDLVERARAAGVDVELAVVGDPSSVAGITDRNAFRIVQESVTNVMKHAPGHRVTISVAIGPDLVDLTVDDHPAAGTASDPARTPLLAPSGNGIIGMRERATAVGGTLTAGPNAAGGWRVDARLPVTTPVPKETP
ncbi:sensor histidine kinase [Curtobacterium pusillum]|uniref:histidine kinase n=1 Tax=Curtobacterium pusillum TaxID=69373 RepID=A0ABX2M2S7_9MICO|nr:sensor histidine kinase [Curtobacterium pusillum]NUU12462.1 sensor histidine kinase [Curtobacterium pusillum]GLK33143.1 two-component sensor histidine kinase [Curtobacterium pusillum]